MVEAPYFDKNINYPPSLGAAQSDRRVASSGPLLIISDYLTILIVPAVGCFLSHAPHNLQKNVLFWNLLAGITVLLIASHQGYRKLAPALVHKNVELVIWCYWATSAAMLLSVLFLDHGHALSRMWTTAELTCTPALLALTRMIPFEGIMGQPKQLAGSGPIVVYFKQCPRGLRAALEANKLSTNMETILCGADNHLDADTKKGAVVAKIVSLLETVRSRNIHDLIFVYGPELESIPAEMRMEMISKLLALPVRIWLAFDLEPQMLALPHLLAHRSGNCKLIPVVTDELLNSQNLAKRSLDIAVSAALLVLFSPLLFTITVLVRLSSPGPVVFKQIRTGAHGHRFAVLKFRTMVHGAASPFAQAGRNDRRVTRIGRFLRRTSLDELLQLINVLKGDMSLVGPRPHAPETQVQGVTFEDAVKLYQLRHRVKPGITGLAQVRGLRGETSGLDSLEQRLASDLEYIKTWSIWLDLLILARTLPVMFLAENAY
jgi:exopolysaccharide biosynthesis polyprenyl glycosylphosphotransferase